MTTSNASPNSKQSEEASPSERFEAVIAYEDLAAGLVAKRCLDQVVEHTAVGLDLRVTFWRLDLLTERAIYAQAVQEAAAADVVLLSLHGDLALPPARQRVARRVA